MAAIEKLGNQGMAPLVLRASKAKEEEKQKKEADQTKSGQNRGPIQENLLGENAWKKCRGNFYVAFCTVSLWLG
jgi:hypothetical protein